jgi:hypothetical protein
MRTLWWEEASAADRIGNVINRLFATNYDVFCAAERLIGLAVLNSEEIHTITNLQRGGVRPRQNWQS